MNVLSLTQVDERWLELRQKLWPRCPEEEHLAEMKAFLLEPEKYRQLLVIVDETPVGLLEASIRNDYVNGTSTSPVGYIEGLFVASDFRKQGVAAQMMSDIEQWFLQKGCCEMASDTDVDNQISIAAHKAMGFEETERAVFFRKEICEQ